MGDRPVFELDHKTPLQAAHLPTINQLAKEGQCGTADPVKPGIVASTVSGTLAILGYDPLEKNVARGVVEALGCGMKIDIGDVAIRGNWATLDEKGLIVDRRAGRIREGINELALSITGQKIDNVRIDVAAGTEHRIAVVMRGSGLQDCVSGSDPGDHFHSGIKPRPIKTLDKNNPKCLRTAELLNLFELKAREILAKHPVNLKRVSNNLLPANAILTREPGQSHYFPKINRPSGMGLSGICITGDDTISGIARVTGLKVCKTKEMTANLDTNLTEKFKVAGKMLDKHGLVVLHIKGGDIAAHNKEPVKKKDFLQKIDSELGKFLKKRTDKLRLAITADHSTWSKEGTHIDDPVPVLLHGHGIKSDSVKEFDEHQVLNGELGRFRMYQLWEKFFK